MIIRIRNCEHWRYHLGSCRGFSLFELVVVITIISVLGMVVIEHLLRYQEMAEKAAMEQLLGILRSAMTLHVSALLVRHQLHRIEEMPQQNPMEWLAEKPSNYLGEYYHPDPNELLSGSWYYDLHNRELVYLVKRDHHFIPGTDGRKWLRFRVELVYSDIEKRTKEGYKDGDFKEVAGVILNLVQQYRWF